MVVLLDMYVYYHIILIMSFGLSLCLCSDREHSFLTAVSEVVVSGANVVVHSSSESQDCTTKGCTRIVEEFL